MIKTKSKTEISRKLFIIGLSLYLIAIIPDCSMPNEIGFLVNVADIIKTVALAVFGFSFVMNIRKYTVCFIALISLIGIVCLISGWKSKSMAPVVLIMMWINGGNTSGDDILKTYFFVLLASFILILLLCFIGILTDRTDLATGHSLGFSHPNVAGEYLMIIVSVYLAIRNKGVKWYDWLICAGVSIILFAFTRSDASFITSIFAIVFSIIIKTDILDSIRPFTIGFSTLLIPVGMVAYNLLAYFADLSNPFWMHVNIFFNGRIRLAKEGLNNIGYSLCGQEVRWDIDEGYNLIDSAYVKTPIVYGVIFTIVLLVLYALFGNSTSRKKQYGLVLLLYVIALHSLAENTLMNIPFNPVLPMLGCVIYNCLMELQQDKER